MKQPPKLRVRDICRAIEDIAPLRLAYDWDRSGLNIGSRDWPVERVLVALTVGPEVAKKALKTKANLIVSHHPVIWDAFKTLDPSAPHTQMCLELASARVACYVAHTNLDVVPGGVNHALAGLLGLQRCKPLLRAPHAGQFKLVTFVPETHLEGVRAAVCEAGAGVIGAYTHCTFSAPGTGTFLPGEGASPYSGAKGKVNEEAERRFETLVPETRLGEVIQALKAAHPYEEVAYDIIPLHNRDTTLGLGARGVLEEAMPLQAFAAYVRERLDVSHVRVAGAPKKTVRRIAVIGGAGGGDVGDVPSDIDVLVTGDVKYHEAETAARRGFAVIDAGHGGTEKCIVPVLAKYLRTCFKGLSVSTFAEPEMFHVVS